jgi:hypothetical protein
LPVKPKVWAKALDPSHVCSLPASKRMGVDYGMGILG